MKKSIFFIVPVATMLPGTPHASSQPACLKAIETAKRFEQANRAANALYQQEKSETSRCAFLNKSREHLKQVARAAEICKAHEPELAEKLRADSVAGLRTLDSPSNTCNPKSKADLLAEKRCEDAQGAFRVKNDLFHKALANYNSNKNNQNSVRFPQNISRIPEYRRKVVSVLRANF